MIIFNNNLPVEINSQEEFDNFAKDYRIIHAAGGIVSNENDEILMIYRLEKWDFPKGKVEAGEAYEEAALREVKEETGLRDITLGKTLPSTFHTYELRGEQILKETHWFRMTAHSQSLVPQTIEDITQAVWITRAEVDEKMKMSYASLEWLWKEIR